MTAQSREFTYAAVPSRVVFGAGKRAELAAEVARLQCSRAFVLSTADQEQEVAGIAQRLESMKVGHYARAAMHVPAQTVREAREEAQRVRADCYVAIGGGSTTGLAKALALETGLPIVAVPTTYAGSEMTPIYGITDGGQKRTGHDERVLPRTAIYDPELTLSLPIELSAASGMNAIAHAVEGLYATDGNPILSLMAQESIAALGRALPLIVGDPQALDARADALCGAWLAGVVLGSTAMALHHKLCHTLGGAFDLPHAQTHAVVLPHAAAYNAPGAPGAMRRIAHALDTDDPAGALYDLAKSTGLPMSLAQIGMREADLDRAAELATQAPYPNPQPITRGAVRVLLQNAYEGRRPVS